MRAIIVYKEASDHAREVVDYLRDYQRFTGKAIETLDPESRSGESFCRAYGIREYPTVIVVSDSGRMQQMWSGRPLPPIDIVSYYDS